MSNYLHENSRDADIWHYPLTLCIHLTDCCLW